MHFPPLWLRDVWTRAFGRAEDRHELDDPITDVSLFLIGAAIQAWCTWHLAMLASWAYGSGFTGWVNTLFYDAFALAALRIGTDSKRTDRVRTLAWGIALLCCGVSLTGNLIAHHVFAPTGGLLPEYAAAMGEVQPYIRDSLGSAPVLLLVLSLVLVAMLKAQKREAVRHAHWEAERTRKREADQAAAAEATERRRVEDLAAREHETRRREAAAAEATARATLERAETERARLDAQRAADELSAAQLAVRTAPPAALPAGGDSTAVQDVDPVDELRAVAAKLALTGKKTPDTMTLLLAAYAADLEPKGAHLDAVIGGNTLGAKAIREARDAGHLPPSERPARLTLAHSAASK